MSTHTLVSKFALKEQFLRFLQEKLRKRNFGGGERGQQTTREEEKKKIGHITVGCRKGIWISSDELTQTRTSKSRKTWEGRTEPQNLQNHLSSRSRSTKIPLINEE